MSSQAAPLKTENLTQAQYLMWLGQRVVPDVPLYNMALAWEYLPGGNLYVVFNRYRQSVRTGDRDSDGLDNSRSLIFKLVKSF